MTTLTMPTNPDRPSLPDYERRILEFDYETRIQDAGQFPTITGYAARYYDGTDATETQIEAAKFERIAPGAFRDALDRLDDVRALLNHNPDLLLGRTSAGTLRLWADDNGLRYELTPPPTQLGRAVTEAVRRGDLNGASFGFKAEKQQLTTEFRSGRNVTVRTLLSVKLGDISLATFPAYRGASAELGSVAASISVPTSRIAIARRRLMMRE